MALLVVAPTDSSARVELRTVVGPSVGVADYDSGGRSGETGESARIGIFGGVGIVTSLMGPLALETGVVVGTRGGKTSFDSPIVLRDEFSWQLDYVSVPVLARWQRSSILPKAGAVLDVLVRSAYEPNPLRTDYDAEGHDVAVVGAIGVDGRVGSVPAFVELEGAWGLVDANIMDGSSDVKIHNRTIRLGVGVIWEVTPEASN